MSYTEKREAILKEGMKIAEAIMDKGDGEQQPLISQANHSTAQAILDSSKLVFEGLSNIADELEMKRKSEEYYDLLDRIDSVEDKIVQLGGELQQVYDSLKIEKRERLTVTFFELRMLAYCFNTEERFNWLQEAVRVYQIHPLIVLGCLLANSKLVVEDQILLIARQIAYSQASPSVFISNNYKRYLSYNYETPEGLVGHDAWVNRSALFGLAQNDSEEKYYALSFVGERINFERNLMWFDPLNSFKVDLITKLKSDLEVGDELATDEMTRIRQLNSLISQINWQIVLGNLRALHNALLAAYKDMKFEQNRRKCYDI